MASTLGSSRRSKYGMRFAAIAYLALVVLIPTVTVLWRTIAQGWAAFIGTITSDEALQALRLSAQIAGWSVALNTVFGVGMAILLVRFRFPGKRLLSVLIDIPVSVSPIVVGLALVLVYAPRAGWFGPWLSGNGIQLIYSLPGMVLATTFVSLPLVLREIVPVLSEAGIDQDQAAQSLGANAAQRFWRITLPTIKWALLYGVVLSIARSMGEFGAVKVVSGNTGGATQTATLYIDQQAEAFQPGAYQMSVLLIAVSVLAIAVIATIRHREH